MTKTLDLFDTTGKVVSEIKTPTFLGTKVDPQLIALAIRVYLANQRQATSQAKSRGEVNKTGHKVYKQKGTGRARHGAKSAPIYVGGGVAHGPSGEQSYGLKLPKKMRQKAIIYALAQAFADKKITLVQDLTKVKPTTKAVSAVLSNLKLENTKVLCLLDTPIKDFVRASKNIDKFTVSQAKRTNIFEIVQADKILIHQPALEIIETTFKA